MKSSSSIVHGGGWHKRQTMGRPKARLFGLLSVVWIAVSIVWSFPFRHGWPKSFGPLEWLSVLMLALHPVFVLLALFFRRTEEPRLIITQGENPDYDPGKLY
jgi:hypothetical protein